MSEHNNGLQRQIGLFGAVTILVGAVIGSGIFMTPGTVAAAAGSFGPFMAAWILAGASGILCALVYAELSPAMPEAGGPSVYITEAYGKGGGFDKVRRDVQQMHAAHLFVEHVGEHPQDI